jgi:hypothetical protein
LKKRGLHHHHLKNLRKESAFTLISVEQSLIHLSHKVSPGAFATSLLFCNTQIVREIKRGIVSFEYVCISIYHYMWLLMSKNE